MIGKGYKVTMGLDTELVGMGRAWSQTAARSTRGPRLPRGERAPWDSGGLSCTTYPL